MPPYQPDTPESGALEPAQETPPVVGSPWERMRRFTTARIGLGRTGGSQPTQALLDFRLSHARARDAVHSIFDAAALTSSLGQSGVEARILHSAASSRGQYLLRPDLGRRLDEPSEATLRGWAATWGVRDIAILVSDGLAAQAAMLHAIPTIQALLKALQPFKRTFYPVLILPFGRVKLQDQIGEILGAKLTLMLLGERPGLGSPDSLGAYFTHQPGPRCSDADRNCLSNIRPQGLPPAAAATKLATLLIRSLDMQCSGVRLKDEDELALSPAVAKLREPGPVAP